MMRKVRPNHSYIVVGNKLWSRRVFEEIISKLAGDWYFIGSPDGLSKDTIASIHPKYIFFLHWSWKVPNEIIDQYECICFHMTDVPYGRGGSPLQNLITRGHTRTKLTALRMTRDFDAGAVYLKEDLSLDGNAEEIYIRATCLSAKMVEQIIKRRPDPVPQTGTVTIFERRRPEESEIPQVPSLKALYDFVRMLDAEGYPRAFLKYKGFCYEFSSAALCDRSVVANVTITPLMDEKS